VPGGPAPLGFAYFSAVKLAGYTAAAWYFRRSYDRPDSNVWKIGVARTALGLAVGSSYGAVWWLVGKWIHVPENSDLIYLALLFPIRLAEWSLILWLFFERQRDTQSRLLRNSLLGMAWSYVLDAIGILAAIVTPGGIWVC
jgi:hypothetical protein